MTSASPSGHWTLVPALVLLGHIAALITLWRSQKRKRQGICETDLKSDSLVEIKSCLLPSGTQFKLPETPILLEARPGLQRETVNSQAGWSQEAQEARRRPPQTCQCENGRDALVGLFGGMAAARGAGDGGPDSLFYESPNVSYERIRGDFLNALRYGERSRYLYNRIYLGRDWEEWEECKGEWVGEWVWWGRAGETSILSLAGCGTPDRSPVRLHSPSPVKAGLEGRNRKQGVAPPPAVSGFCPSLWTVSPQKFCYNIVGPLGRIRRPRPNSSACPDIVWDYKGVSLRFANVARIIGYNEFLTREMPEIRSVVLHKLKRCCHVLVCDMKYVDAMDAQQQKYRNVSTDSAGRERVPSDDGFYQGMLKAMDGRKGD
ncbi:hypothetical protein N1851_030348 [Merluccius polli]|uniref:Uncharacterized protein n=1 Tax=Merluccius polli TaxID=89951 RepID=A0AA47NQY4_MERPO|nr:hypothetical protein N1851_030348 [Merluccius polli]